MAFLIRLFLIYIICVSFLASAQSSEGPLTEKHLSSKHSHPSLRGESPSLAGAGAGIKTAPRERKGSSSILTGTELWADLAKKTGSIYEDVEHRVEFTVQGGDFASFHEKHRLIMERNLIKMPKNPVNRDLFNNLIIVNFYSQILAFHSYSAGLLEYFDRINNLLGYDAKEYKDTDTESLELFLVKAAAAGYEPRTTAVLKELLSFDLPLEEGSATVNSFKYISIIYEGLSYFTEESIPENFRTTVKYHLKRDIKGIKRIMDSSTPDVEVTDEHAFKLISAVMEHDHSEISSTIILPTIALNNEFIDMYAALTELNIPNLKQKKKSQKVKPLSREDNEKIYQWLLSFKEKIQRAIILQIDFINQNMELMLQSYCDDNPGSDVYQLAFILEIAKRKATLLPALDTLAEWVEKDTPTTTVKKKKKPRQKSKKEKPSASIEAPASPARTRPNSADGAEHGSLLEVEDPSTEGRASSGSVVEPEIVEHATDIGQPPGLDSSLETASPAQTGPNSADGAEHGSLLEVEDPSTEGRASSGSVVGPEIVEHATDIGQPLGLGASSETASSAIEALSHHGSIQLITPHVATLSGLEDRTILLGEDPLSDEAKTPVVKGENVRLAIETGKSARPSLAPVIERQVSMSASAGEYYPSPSMIQPPLPPEPYRGSSPAVVVNRNLSPYTHPLQLRTSPYYHPHYSSASFPHVAPYYPYPHAPSLSSYTHTHSPYSTVSPTDMRSSSPPIISHGVTIGVAGEIGFELTAQARQGKTNIYENNLNRIFPFGTTSFF